MPVTVATRARAVRSVTLSRTVTGPESAPSRTRTARARPGAVTASLSHGPHGGARPLAECPPPRRWGSDDPRPHPAVTRTRHRDAVTVTPRSLSQVLTATGSGPRASSIRPVRSDVIAGSAEFNATFSSGFQVGYGLAVTESHDHCVRICQADSVSGYRDRDSDDHSALPVAGPGLRLAGAAGRA